MRPRAAPAPPRYARGAQAAHGRTSACRGLRRAWRCARRRAAVSLPAVAPPPPRPVLVTLPRAWSRPRRPPPFRFRAPRARGRLARPVVGALAPCAPPLGSGGPAPPSSPPPAPIVAPAQGRAGSGERLGPAAPHFFSAAAVGIRRRAGGVRRLASLPPSLRVVPLRRLRPLLRLSRRPRCASCLRPGLL